VRDAAELERAVAQALPHSRTGRVIVEEYVDGPEFSIDAVVVDGAIRIRGLADRHIAFAPYFVEIGHTMPTAFEPDVAKEVLRVFELGVKALGIGRGAAKGDIKYCPSRGTAVVGEIAARLSGGYMSGWTYPYASGLDPVSEAIDIALGRRPSFGKPAWDCVSAERAWISIPGKIARVTGLGAAARTPFVKDVFPRSLAGDRVAFPVNNVQKCGNVISQARSRAEAESAAESAARAVLIRLEPGDPGTAAFLRGEGRIQGPDGSVWPPAAYDGLSAMTLALIESMPEVLKDSRPARTVSLAPVQGLEREAAVDWLGRDLPAALEAVRELTGATLGLDGDLVLGRGFWKALLAGGYQAGAWVVDTAVLERNGP